MHNPWQEGECAVQLTPDWTIHYQRQRHANGCVLACLAMVTDQSYEKVHEYLTPKLGYFDGLDWRLGTDFDKVGMALMDDGLFYLRDMGFAYQKRYRSPYTTAHGQPPHEPWPCEPWADVHICSVLTSQSHAVVMLGDGRVLDPAFPDRRSLTEYAEVHSIIAVYRVGGKHSGTQRIYS